MAFKDLREFLTALKQAGEVIEVDQDIDWNLEYGALLRLTAEKVLPCPVANKIKGYAGWRYAGGYLSTEPRFAIAMGLDPATPMRELMQDYLRRKDRRIKPVVVKTGPCKENIITGDDVDLFKLPAPMMHEGDGGRYIGTLHTVVTKRPDMDWTNWGIYRTMVRDKSSMGGLILPYRDIGDHLYRYWEPRGEPMPFASVIGMEPVGTIMSSTRTPYGASEVDIVGGLRGEPVELVQCETVDLMVPATSELVIEGLIYPGEKDMEGPFGEYSGYRTSPRDRRPIYRVTAITHRNNPIFAISSTGMPIHDGTLIQAITDPAEVLDNLRKQGIPVVDICGFPWGVNHVWAVSVKVSYANIAAKVATGIWGLQAGHDVPYVIVVEDDVDPFDINAVIHAIGTKCHPYRGITRIEQAPGQPLQPFLSRHERIHQLSAKAFFDCTWPVDWDPSIAVPPRASFDKIFPKRIQERVLDNMANYGYKGYQHNAPKK